MAKTLSRRPPPTRSPARTVVEWVIIVAAALVVAVLVRTFFLQPFYIPSGSMEPTLEVGDRVLVNKLSYDLHQVHRGDIIVFTKPANDPSPGVKDLIKRVIGLPGETIQGIDGQVYIDGRKLTEPYLPRSGQSGYPGPLTAFPASFPPTVVPRGDYYVMGDNRGDSADSRFIGPISGKLIVGRAFFRVWPMSSIGRF